MRRRYLERMPSGFTLLELLVVLSVISLVVALLLPAVAKARRQALQVACASNLRQLGVAFIGYANDNKGWFPSPASGAWGPYPEDWVYWQVGRDVTQSPVLRYVGDSPQVLVCPAGVADRDVQPYQTASGLYPFSYSINVRFTAYGGTVSRYGPPWRSGPPCPLGKVVEPSHKILAVEEDSTLINDGAWWPSQGLDQFGAQQSFLSVRHDKGREVHEWNQANLGRGLTNVVFADGHCEFFERSVAPLAVYSDPFYRGGN